MHHSLSDTQELRLDESGDSPSTLLRFPLDQGDDEHPSNENRPRCRYLLAENQSVKKH